VSVGKTPEKTICLAWTKPGRGSSAGRRVSVTVSPTRLWASSLTPAMRKPTSPALSSGNGTAPGLNTPTSWTS